MPKKSIAKESVTPEPPSAAKRVTKPRAVQAGPRVTQPRVTQRAKTVKHSKAAAASVTSEVAGTLSAHDKIALIAYSYWEARGFQPGSAEQDWLRAEQEFLLSN